MLFRSAEAGTPRWEAPTDREMATSNGAEGAVDVLVSGADDVGVELDGAHGSVERGEAAVEGIPAAALLLRDPPSRCPRTDAPPPPGELGPERRGGSGGRDPGLRAGTAERGGVWGRDPGRIRGTGSGAGTAG